MSVHFSERLASALSVPREALALWETGRTAQLTCGVAWDVAEVEFELARRARAVLGERRARIGPYISSGAQRAVWIFLPLGTAYRLIGIPGVIVQPPGWQMTAPSPRRYDGLRTWVLPPDGLPGSGLPWLGLTNPDGLKDALTAPGTRERSQCQ